MHLVFFNTTFVELNFLFVMKNIPPHDTYFFLPKKEGEGFWKLCLTLLRKFYGPTRKIPHDNHMQDIHVCYESDTKLQLF